MASLHIDFNKYEREMFLTCYAARIAMLCANNSCLKVNTDYILETENFMEKIYYDAIEVEDKYLLPFCLGSESKGMYYKMYEIYYFLFYVC